MRFVGRYNLYMATKRKSTSRGASEAPILSFNDAANSFKVSETGFDIVTIVGSVAAGVAIPANKPIVIMNTAAAWGYVKLSTATIGAAPTGITDGIGIPPNGILVLASGANTQIRSSAATIGVYVANEATISTGSDQAAV
jgi:hypothetical protein